MTRILVPTDFSTRALEALRLAVQYVTRVGGELLLLHVVEGEPLRWSAADGLPETPSVHLGPAGSLVPAQGPQKLVSRDLCVEAEWKLAALLPPQPDRFRTLVTVGKPADEIVRVARQQRADLIIMGGQGGRGFWPWLRRSIADRVRRKAPLHVVTVEDDRVCLGRFPLYDRGGVRDAEASKGPGTLDAWERGVPHTAPTGTVPGVTAPGRPEPAHESPATPRRPRRAGRVRRRAVSRGHRATKMTPR
jgi:nucleotide-binding universal stress UspA family protein